MQVLVAEPSAPIANALRKFLDGVAEVTVVHFVDEAVQHLATTPCDVVVASVSPSFDGEVLCARVKMQVPDMSVVLVYPLEEVEQAPRRAFEAQATAFLVGPLKKHHVVSTVRVADQVRRLTQRAESAEHEVKGLQAQLAEKSRQLAVLKPRTPAGSGPGINTDDAFFKKYMLLEVKRSKRYHYAVALLLVGLDHFDEHLAANSNQNPGALRATIRAEVLKMIGELIRDIDIAMSFAEDKFLVFLPHTPRGGSLVVARRIIERVKRLTSFSGGTASVGVASFDPRLGAQDPKSQVSFGGLVRQANELLQKGQDAGGDRVEAPAALEADPPSSKPKKNRISMG